MQKSIRKNPNAEEVKESKLQAELDLFLSLDKDGHETHFTDHTPTIEEWKQKRHFYAEDHLLEDMEDIWADHDKSQWFNTLDITLYLREPEKINEDKLKEYQAITKKRIPGYDF